MSMTRWDPFREMLSLREAMQQLMEESFVRPSQGRGGASGVQGLPLDVHEEEGAYIVRASLPGYKPEDIQVTVMGDTLTIRAESRGEAERTRGNYLVRERHAGATQRSFSLPSQVDSNAVEADFEHGVLTLTLPRSAAAQPRRIQVRAAGGIGAGETMQGRGGERPQDGGMVNLASGGAGMGTMDAGTGGDLGQGTAQGTARGEEAGRLPSLEAQTPGLDTAQERRTSDDARSFFSQGQGGGQGGDQGGTRPPAADALANSGEGYTQPPPDTRDEDLPPGGDVRTAYSSDRDPGEAEPTGRQG